MQLPSRAVGRARPYEERDSARTLARQIAQIVPVRDEKSNVPPRCRPLLLVEAEKKVGFVRRPRVRERMFQGEDFGFRRWNQPAPSGSVNATRDPFDTMCTGAAPRIREKNFWHDADVTAHQRAHCPG